MALAGSPPPASAIFLPLPLSSYAMLHGAHANIALHKTDFITYIVNISFAGRYPPPNVPAI